MTARSLPRRRGLRHWLGTALTVALVGGGVGLAPTMMPVAAADTTPDAGTPATVTADALPTWQVNGVVWSQVVVGNTVYATGKFSTARPPGVAVGGVGEVSVGNLIAYDIRTGNMIPSFNHVLNGQGLVVHATVDGSRLYVGGDFTTVDGQPRGHIAAIDLTTNTLVAGFAPTLDGTVKAITTNGSWVYAGGGFAHAGDVFRNRLAAFAAVNGGLSSAWAPNASTSDVRAMVMAPDRSKVIIGGSFLTMSGVTSNGMAAVDPISGAVLTWNANQVIKDYDKGGITSLSTDGVNVYGSAFAFGTGGTFEGSFSIDPAQGNLNWVADCLGDAYSAYASTDVVYSVGHAHNCSNIGSFPDTNPRVRWQRALAMTKAPSGTITKPDAYGWDFSGQRSPGVLHWFPGLEDGTASGQNQAAWSVVGSGDYIALGGEFPIVNNAYQQGLTRFATSKVAPNKAGPRFTVVPATNVPTVATALKPGTVRLSYGSAWDRDNESLTYEVLRDGSTVVDSSVLKTNFWTTPTRTFTDTNVPVGSHSYTVRVKDPFGNSNTTPQSNVVSVPASTTTYAAAALADSPSAYWRLDEGSGPTAYDFTGNGNEATAATGVSFSAGGGTGDDDTAAQLSGTSTGVLASTVSGVAPDAFTEEAWFKTTTTAGGKLIGYGNKTNGSSTSYDRHLYMDNAGRLFFGVYSGSPKTVNSPSSYNDGQWHHVAATLGAGGQQLYVDGQLVARNAAVSTAQANLVGQWVLGGDTLGTWPSAPTSKFFSGSLDDVAIYPTALTRDQLRAHYAASGRTATTVAAPTDAYGSSVTGSRPSAFWRLDEAAGPSAVDSSGSNESGVYAGSVTYGQPGAVGGGGSAAGLDGSTGNVGSVFSWTAPQTYSAEVWFKTSSTTGGKLIGFGDKQTGSSTLIDRNLTVLSSGQLRFATGVNGGATIDSPKSYRDGQWHQGVITQGAAGMRLYVDGDLVGSAAATSSQTFAGYWRIGGDKVWPGSASSYLSGSLDEFSVYPRVLTASEVALHYTATGRTGPNVPPTAAFTPTVADLVASVDASASSDPDGTIASYGWDFGDGTSDTGATVTHSYSAAGTYSITLTVKDNSGAAGSVTKAVTVVAPNQLPTAAFVATSPTDLTAALDASTSTDPDGTIASYVWEFGDGVTGSGVSASHTYSTPGTYPVKLTVTDDRGGASSVTSPVTVAGPFARDAFARTISGGWGSADVGGPWSLQGAASLFSVAGGRGSMTMSAPGKGASAALGAVSSTDTDVQLGLALDKASTGGGQYASIIGRGNFTDGYRAKVRVASTGALSVMLTRLVSNAETELTNVVVPGVTYVPGTSYSVRMQVWGTGTTNLRAKVWKTGDPEPVSWNTTKTDTTASLQAAGGVGVVSYLSGTATNAPVALTISNVVARATGN